MAADWTIEVRLPAEAKGVFSSSLCVQSDSGASLLYNGTRDRFPGAEARPGRDADHSLQSNAKVENE
jgi:hypothetical protein